MDIKLCDICECVLSKTFYIYAYMSKNMYPTPAQKEKYQFEKIELCQECHSQLDKLYNTRRRKMKKLKKESDKILGDK